MSSDLEKPRPTTATELAASIANPGPGLEPAAATGVATSMAAPSNALPPATATGVALEARSTVMTGGRGALATDEIKKTLDGERKVGPLERFAFNPVAADSNLAFGDAFGEAFGPRQRPPRVFNESVVEVLEANDTLDARATVSAQANIDASATFEAVVVPAIWYSQGDDPHLRIDRAKQELEAVRAAALAWKAQIANNPRAGNGPPGLVDDPDIDIEAVDAAIQCLAVLRPLLSQPQPDIELLKLLWRVVTATLRVVKRFAAWTWGRLKEFESTVFGKAVTGAIGVKAANDGYDIVMSQIVKHGPQGLQSVEHLLKGALAALGHPVL